MTSRLNETASSDLHIGGRFRAASASRVCESHQLADSVATTGVGPAARLHDTGGRVVFTNGVFDLLHPGHVRYLNDARLLGDALIVGINSDRSVRANKGPSRPITPERERAELVAALRSVDAVTIFDEDTLRADWAVQPDVLVKGADWGADNIVGRDIVEAVAARLCVSL